MALILDYTQIKKIVNQGRKAGVTFIFNTGCYNNLHIGHVKMLKNISTKADYLIVGIGSDDTLKTLKGRCDFQEKYRAEVIASLNMVDYVVILNQEKWDGVSDHQKLLELIRPDIYHLVDEGRDHVNKRIEKAQGLGISVITTKPETIEQDGKIIRVHSSGNIVQ